MCLLNVLGVIIEFVKYLIKYLFKNIVYDCSLRLVLNEMC